MSDTKNLVIYGALVAGGFLLARTALRGLETLIWVRDGNSYKQQRLLPDAHVGVDAAVNVAAGVVGAATLLYVAESTGLTWSL